MLPKTGTILKQDFEIVTMPSKTFRIEENRIVGYTDIRALAATAH